MKPLDFVHVTRCLDRTYRAEIGDFMGVGSTKAAATCRLFEAIAQEGRINTTPETRMDAQGSVWVLYRVAGNWAYACRFRGAKRCNTILGVASRDEAISAMERHMADWVGCNGAETGVVS